MASSKALQKAAQAWGKEKTKHKEMDADLAESFAEIIDEIEQTPAQPNLGCATTRELLDEIRARIEIDGNLDYRTIDNV